MATTRQKATNSSDRRDLIDFAHTGPDTLAGRYMRLFWQPIFHSEDLPPGQARPVKVMGVDHTLFRGESGEPHLIDSRCAHRQMQLSPGWVEGDSIRCFYHGWRYDGTGQCVEQPAEPKPFCQKIKIGGYPVRDYLGLIFAYLGEGEPPPFPRYHDFEDPNVYLEMDSYPRACNFFNNLENAMDTAHVGFVHRGTAGSWDGVTDSPLIQAKESRWGITNFSKRPSGGDFVSQFGMPNMFHARVLPIEPGVQGWREFLVWWTPIDDHNHIQYTVNAWRLPADKLEEYKERRNQTLAKRKVHQSVLAEQVLKGDVHVDDIDPDITDYIRLQDDVAQIGQAVIPDRGSDRLGQSDLGIILIRKIWARELRALAEGKSLTEWTYDVEDLLLFRN